jgi:hypothetical protein
VNLSSYGPSWNALETEQPSLWALCEGNLEFGYYFPWDHKGYVEEGSGDEQLFIGAPLVNLEGGSYTGDGEI